MPSTTVATSAENFTRIISALDANMDRKEVEGVEETDGQLFKRDLKRYYIEMVFRNERQQAEGTVLADLNIADIT